MTYHEDELTRPVTVVELPDFVRDAGRIWAGMKSLFKRS